MNAYSGRDMVGKIDGLVSVKVSAAHMLYLIRFPYSEGYVTRGGVLDDESHA